MLSFYRLKYECLPFSLFYFFVTLLNLSNFISAQYTLYIRTHNNIILLSKKQ